MNEVEIRRTVSGDETILAKIQTASWRDAFCSILPAQVLEKHLDLPQTEQMYRRVLNDSRYHGFLLSINANPHCMAFWSTFRKENGFSRLAELVCIHSFKENWGNGYGSLMMEQVLSDIQSAGYDKVVLWVFEQNQRARRFYEKHGFILTEQSQNSFGANEVLYLKTLSAK